MKEQSQHIRRALISVSDKTNLIEFAKGLSELNIEIISTGGTASALREAGIKVKEVSQVTGFPEMMEGRLKTLHPRVHGGILGKRDEHATVAKVHGIEWIDLVVVNLYPFEKTIQKENVTLEDAIENIDIGGPAMIRSAAKNMEWTTVVVDPLDYQDVLQQMKNGISFSERKKLAVKAFQHTSLYDKIIFDYLKEEKKSENLSITFQKISDLRYGENPHQSAAAFSFSDNVSGVFSAKQHQGKPLSYNNMTDADAAHHCVREFYLPACAVIKHANPCGAAVANTVEEAFEKALSSDPVSAFGGIVAINRPCSKVLAEKMSAIFFEVIIAPSFDDEALMIFSKKPNLRILEWPLNKNLTQKEYKFIEGGLLIQDKDVSSLQRDNLKIVTNQIPSEEEINTMLFAWPILKQMKSNAILIAKDNTTIGIGVGQVSRIDAVDLAIRKSHIHLQNAILASDAFFPFRDSIDRIAGTGIRAILQPGGSVKDEEVIAACNEHKIAMVFTGVRCFKH